MYLYKQKEQKNVCFYTGLPAILTSNIWDFY